MENQIITLKLNCYKKIFKEIENKYNDKKPVVVKLQAFCKAY